MKGRRLPLLTLAFLVAGCGTQAAISVAPTASPSFTPAATATPRPPNASSDVLYVRRQTGDGGRMAIDVIDAKTGALRRHMPNGVVSADRRLLFSTEGVEGGTRTLVTVTDLATGAKLRSLTVDGELGIVTDANTGAGLTSDSRWLALWRPPLKIDDRWRTQFAVVDTVTGATRTTEELSGEPKGCCPHSFIAISPDGGLLYLSQATSGGARTRVYDMARRSFTTSDAAGEIHGWDGRLVGYRTPFVTRGDRLYSLFAEQAYVLALDVASRTAARIALPEDQRTTDFEKYLLWSLAVTPDGGTAYAVDPALGVIDEIDLKQLTVARRSRLSPPGSDAGIGARIAQAVFPRADAKRYLRMSTALSADGRTLYAVSEKGIAVIDTATLALRGTWLGGQEIGSLALSPDGARLYAVADAPRSIEILRASDGSPLGSVGYSTFTSDIVRIDVP